MFFLIILLIIVFGFVIYILYKLKNKPNIHSVDILSAQKKEKITLEEIIMFFKKPEILTVVKNDLNIICVAICAKQEKSKEFHILACLFDKEKNAIVNYDIVLNLLGVTLDQDLQDAFGEKSMIVLK